MITGIIGLHGITGIIGNKPTEQQANRTTDQRTNIPTDQQTKQANATI